MCDKHATLLSDDSASALRNSIADSIEKHRAEIQFSGRPGHGRLSKSQDMGAGRDPGSQPGGVCLRADLGTRGERRPGQGASSSGGAQGQGPDLQPRSVSLPFTPCCAPMCPLTYPPGERPSGKDLPQPAPFPSQREPAGVRRGLGAPGL